MRLDLDSQIVLLTPDFYKKYNKTDFPEILQKDNRAYNCLLIDTHYGYFICIPFRSNISHNYAFFFRGTRRALKSRSGLDYTKMIITDGSYISKIPGIVDRDEFIETRKHISYIAQKAVRFLEDYIEYRRGNKTISDEEFKRRYTESTLQYFDTEIGLQVSNKTSL